MICLINTGKNWTEENESYPLRKKFKIPNGENSSNSLFSNEEVIKMRTLYSEGVSPKDIASMYPEISINTIKAILYGRSYKFLPYWKFSEKKWVEPCIDYPQSLK